MKRQIITQIFALALTIGAQAQQDNGMDDLMSASRIFFLSSR
jgi:hypothetical protein